MKYIKITVTTGIRNFEENNNYLIGLILYVYVLMILIEVFKKEREIESLISFPKEL